MVRKAVCLIVLGVVILGLSSSMGLSGTSQVSAALIKPLRTAAATVVPTFVCGGSNACVTNNPSTSPATTTPQDTPIAAATMTTGPTATPIPCSTTNAVDQSVQARRSRHKNKNNSGSSNSLLQLFEQLINYILKLLGLGSITFPDNSSTPSTTPAPGDSTTPALPSTTVTPAAGQTTVTPTPPCTTPGS